MGASVEDEDDNAYIIEKSAAATELTREQLCKNTVRETNALMESADNIIKKAYTSLADHVDRVSEYVQAHGPQSWPEIVQDAVWQFGTKCASAVAACEDYMEQEHTPFNTLSKCSAVRPAVVVDRHNMMETLSDIDGHLMVIKEAKEAKSEYEPVREQARAELDTIRKEAATAPGPTGDPHPKPKQPKDKPENNKPKDKPEKKDSKPKVPVKRPDVFIQTKKWDVVSPTMDSIKTFSDALGIFQEDPNVRKKYISEAKDRAAQDVTLHRLIMSDPVLSEADPDVVRSHYNTIASIAPSVAVDPNLASAVLKESIQYGSIPLSMSKDLASFEDSLQKARLDNSKLQADYGVRGYSQNNDI